MNGSNTPDETLPEANLPPQVWPLPAPRDDFDAPALDIRWQTLRTPLTDKDFSLTARPGHLRLYGGNGLGSRFTQSLIAQRITEHSGLMETCLAFEPAYYKQMAGLILWYDNENYFYLHLTRDEELGKVVTLLRAENKQYTYPCGYTPVPENRPIRLRMEMQNGYVTFAWAVDDEWHILAEGLDASFLSDEACNEGWFTGTMCGVCCQDLTGSRLHADFDYMTYQAQVEHRE